MNLIYKVLKIHYTLIGKHFINERYPTKEAEDADEDSCDYEPWVYKDKKSIAISLKLLQSENHDSLFIRNNQDQTQN